MRGVDSIKRVLIIINRLGMGGAEKSLISLLNTMDSNKLSMNDIRIYLLLADSRGEFTSQIPEYVECIKTPKSYMNYAVRFADLVKETPYDIISIFKKLLWKYNSLRINENMDGNEKYWLANKKYIEELKGEYDYVLAYMNGTPTYYAADKVKGKVNYFWIHNEYEKLEYNDDFQRSFFEKADKLITISKGCANSLKKAFPEYAEKVEVIENISSKKMIDFQSIQNEPEEINTDEFNLISVGRLVDQKGYDIGIEALRILKEKGIKVKWFILGEGNRRTILQQQIEEAGLEGIVQLLGNRNNPYAYLRVADVFIQTSRYEGKSIALDEAKIMCKPILVSDYATVRDSIDDGINGVICKLDPQSIAIELENLIGDENLRKRLSSNLSNMQTSNELEIEKYYKLLGM